MHQLARNLHLQQDGPALYELRDLSYTYPNGQMALEGIDLDIASGDRIAIIGQNGAGKSTLLKHLNGLLSVQQGSLAYKGQALLEEHLRRARLEIGLLFQDPDDQLFCNTLEEDVLFGPLNQGLDITAATAATNTALAAVGLTGAARRAPHKLSYGQRKRAGLAGLLAMSPDVLLLDEPTANLDPHQEEVLLQLLKDFTGTLICITHNLLFAYEICERAVVLDRGHIHHDYTFKELVSHKASLREHGLDFTFRFAESPMPEDLQADDQTQPPVRETHTEGHLAPENSPLIQLQDYGFTYPDGTEALIGLDLDISRGETLAIVGENGAGKTTLVSCLMGLCCGSGEYRLDGQQVTDTNRRDNCRQIGMVFQDSSDQLFCPSCYEEVAFGPRQLGLPNETIKKRVAEALGQAGLSGFDERVPLHLSGGERKRLALAAVLAMQPQILILDEPTAGLDPAGEELLLDILKGMDVTLILISHDLFFVRRLTHRTLVLHEGYLVQNYRTEDFFTDTNLTSLNQLDFTYRNRCGLEIMRLQHEHEHSHQHHHSHEHPHRHDDLVHSHLHEHEHEHAHTFSHTHRTEQDKPSQRPANSAQEPTHGHLPRADQPHDHEHSNHEEEPHKHEH